MPSVPVNLLDPTLGIQNVIEPGSDVHIPDARPLAATLPREAGLDELYNRSEAEKQIAAAICPPVGDGSILQPEIFHAELRGGLEALKGSHNPAVRIFVRDELAPLLENADLLKAYTGLMLGG